MAAPHRNNLTPLDRLRPKIMRIIDNSKDERPLVKYLEILEHENLLDDDYIYRSLTA